METNPLLHALINTGGVGILAAVLLYLHINSLKSFRKELSEERKQCHADHEKIMNSVNRLTKTVARSLFKNRTDQKT